MYVMHFHNLFGRFGGKCSKNRANLEKFFDTDKVFAI